MGGVVNAVKSVAKPVVKAVAAPATAAVNIAQGKNVGESLGKGALQVAAVPGAALGSVDSASGGVLKGALGYVPIIGGSANKFIGSSSEIGQYGSTKGRAQEFSESGSKLAATYFGGAALAGSLGTVGGYSAAGLLSQGNFKGAASGAAGELAGNYFPDEKNSFNEYKSALSPFTSLFGNKSGSASPSDIAAGGGFSEGALASGGSSKGALVIGAIGLVAAIAIIKKRKKHHGR